MVVYLNVKILKLNSVELSKMKSIIKSSIEFIETTMHALRVDWPFQPTLAFRSRMLNSKSDQPAWIIVNLNAEPNRIIPLLNPHFKQMKN